MKKLLLFLLLALPSYAQNSNGQATDIRKGAALPLTCGAGQAFYKTTSPIGIHQCINSIWVYMGAGGTGQNGRDGADGAPGANGYTPNQIISGCNPGYVSGFTWTISQCNYWLQNIQRSAVQGSVTGPAADDTYDRFDVIAVDKSGVYSVVEGVAAASPAKPILDPSEQMEITFYRVNAGATTPADVVTLDIYHENAEWTCSVSATANCASTVNPHLGTKDVEGTAMPQAAFIRFTIPAGVLDVADYRDLIFSIAPKAPFVTHSVTLQWYNGTTAKCTPVSLANNQFTFSDANTGYQQIVVPLSTFNCSGIPVTRLQLTVAGSATNTIGFYLDDVYLQGGVSASTGSSGMQWLRTWNATTLYKIQDTVFRNGSSYVATVTNSNSAPESNPLIWDVMDTHQPAGVDGNLQYKAGNQFAGLNTVISGSNITFPGTLTATQLISSSTTNQALRLVGSTSPALSASGEIAIVSTAGTCQISQNGGAFQNCSAAFGGGTVTTLSVGNLSPIFTTVVSNPTTTPSVAYTLATATAHAFLGNNTASTAAPAYVQPAFTDLSGSMACTQNPAGTGDVTNSAGSCANTIAANAVTSAKEAVVNTRRTCMIQVGDGTNTVVTADYSPFLTGACYIPYAATIVEVNIQSDAGTPSVQLERRRGAATLADLLSGALAAAGTTHTCAMSSTSQTCIDGTTSSNSITLSNTSLSAGDVIEVKSGTGSTEKSMRIAVTFTVN